MDELTLRLECLRLACSARTSTDVTRQAESFVEWVTKKGELPTSRFPVLKRASELEQESDGATEQTAPRVPLKLPDAARRT